jgi:glycosyltransferase involved in cell wall biosynthesis
LKPAEKADRLALIRNGPQLIFRDELNREVSLLRARKPDVLVPLDGDPTTLMRSAQCVLDHAGPMLGRLVVYGAFREQPGLSESLDALAQRDSRITRFEIDSNQSHVDACRLAMATCSGDVVLLNCDSLASVGWLEELAGVAHAEERTACVSPLVNESWARFGSSSTLANSSAASLESIVRVACGHLPRWTVTPVASSECVYLRQDVIEAVGLFDPILPAMHAALAEWVLRAQSLGFVAKRANHIFVPCLHARSRDEEIRLQSGRAPDVVHERHSHFAPQLERFEHSLDAHLASHSVQVETTGKVSVALDIRHIPPEQVGTRTYAVNLAQALGALSDVELTLLVRDPAQARGIEGRVVTPERWRDDVALIHKPAQVIDPSELELLFESSSHVVITYQDLIAYRIPLSFPSARPHADYCATSRLSLTAVQKIIAYSQSAQAEIVAEFGIPPEEVSVVPLGVDPEWFRDRPPLDRLIRSALRLPGRYFFSVASDYPHKNLPNLLDAYAALRSGWQGGEPPSLVLAGYSSGARTGLYPHLESKAQARGVIFLGPVSQASLKVLYQDALALVFCSLYEGFGLPPLEAMAAGTPVIAMPFSAVPEVGGDCVLYPDGLSSSALAKAMELIARDEALRAELRNKSSSRVRELQWKTTARKTLDVYRSAVLRPSERSLRMRRLLRDAIVHWSGNHALRGSTFASGTGSSDLPASIGIRQAYRALDVAVRTRLSREIRRFRRIAARRTA